MDLRAGCYRSGSRLSRTLNRYLDTIAYTPGIEPPELRVIIPKGLARASQLMVIERVKERAESLGLVMLVKEL
jgi:hypothetical protein